MGFATKKRGSGQLGFEGGLPSFFKERFKIGHQPSVIQPELLFIRHLCSGFEQAVCGRKRTDKRFGLIHSKHKGANEATAPIAMRQLTVKNLRFQGFIDRLLTTFPLEVTEFQPFVCVGTRRSLHGEWLSSPN